MQEKQFLRGTSVDTLLQGAHIASDKDESRCLSFADLPDRTAMFTQDLRAMRSCCEQLDIFPDLPSLEQPLSKLCLELRFACA